MLVVERLADIDRLNRLWIRINEQNFVPEVGSLYPMRWQDIGGDHSTWFFKATNIVGESTKPLSFSSVPLPGKELDAVGNPTRVMLDGVLAWQVWRSYEEKQLSFSQTLQWKSGEEVHVEIGTAGRGVHYAYIASNTDVNVLTVFLPQEEE